MSATLAELARKVSRVSDVYAKGCDISRDEDWYLLKLQEELGELTAEHLRNTGRGRLKGADQETVRQALEDEAADLFASVLLYVGHAGIDIEAALDRKWFSYLPCQQASQ